MIYDLLPFKAGLCDRAVAAFSFLITISPLPVKAMLAEVDGERIHMSIPREQVHDSQLPATLLDQDEENGSSQMQREKLQKREEQAEVERAVAQEAGEIAAAMGGLVADKERETFHREVGSGKEQWREQGMRSDQRLAKSAQSVQEALKKKGLDDCNVIEFTESTRTAADAAMVIGCDVAQIVKSLIFKTKRSHKPVLVLASGQNRVNEAVIASYVGEKIIKADANFTKDVTGFAIGGIPPMGHKQPIDFIFLDKDLLRFKTVWAAAGTPNALVQLPGDRLMEVTQGKIIEIQ